MDPWINSFLQHLIPTLLNRANGHSLVENTGVVLGRFGFFSPRLVAPHLDKFAERWLEIMPRLPDNAEKESAYIGFCRIIGMNPNSLAPHFGAFCESITKLSNISPQLHEVLKQIVEMFREAFGPRWTQLRDSYPQNVQQRLAMQFGI